MRDKNVGPRQPKMTRFKEEPSPEYHPGFKRAVKPYEMAERQKAWERTYDSIPGKNRKNQIMGGDFDSMNTKDRYRTYIPVNETDT